MKQALLLFILCAFTLASCSKKDDAKPKPSLKNTQWVSDDGSIKAYFNGDATGKLTDVSGSSLYTFSYFEGETTNGNTEFSMTIKDDDGTSISTTGYYNSTILVLKLADNSFTFTKIQ